MSWTTLLLQVVLPLSLLAWLAWCPAKGWLASGLQWLSVAAVLLALSRVALWTMPPFWGPSAYGLTLLLIAITQVVRRGGFGRGLWHGLWHTSAANSVVILLVSGLGLLSGYMAYQALAGRVLPEGEVVDIAAPFPPGHYLVAHGGATEMVNVHLKTLNANIERFRPWRGQSRALDVFRITPLGWHKQGWQPTDPAQYLTFATPVLAPCQGQVAQVVDRHPDMPVPEMDRDHLAGNYVALDCGDFFVILAHLSPGSISVAVGDRVAVGDPLGQMGNSGNSSEPHLHLHAQRGLPADAALGGEPLWLTINGRFLTRNDRVCVLGVGDRATGSQRGPTRCLDNGG